MDKIRKFCIIVSKKNTNLPKGLENNVIMNPNPNPKQIIVVQNVGDTSLFAFKTIIAEPLGLADGADYAVAVDSDDIEMLVFDDGKPQLLIIDNLNTMNPGNTSDLSQAIPVWREKNSRLVIVGYSSLKHDGSFFDQVIDHNRSGSTRQLKDFISQFLAGQPQVD